MTEANTEKSDNRYPRSSRRWDRREARRAMFLLAAGYEDDEVADHIGRKPISLSAMLHSYGTTLAQLRAGRAISKMEQLSLPNLPLYEEGVSYRDVEKDFPHLVPKVLPTQTQQPPVSPVDAADSFSTYPEDTFTAGLVGSLKVEDVPDLTAGLVESGYSSDYHPDNASQHITRQGANDKI